MIFSDLLLILIFCFCVCESCLYGLALQSPIQELVGYGPLGFVSFCFKVMVKGGLWFRVWRLALKLGTDLLSKSGFLYLGYFLG